MLVLGLALAGFTGCASVSIQEKQESQKRIPQKKPSIFYVMDFSTEETEFNVDREGDELKQFKRETARELSGILIENMTKHLGVADRLVKAPKNSMDGWLIHGRFLRVNQGSRALRMGVGFGAGGTKMETEVSVYDLSISATHPFMRFRTTGGSNAEPGIAMSVGAAILTGGTVSGLEMGPGLAGRSVKGLTEDSHRTARMITAVVSQYLATRGWISPEKALRPKEPFEKEINRLTSPSNTATNASPAAVTQPLPAPIATNQPPVTVTNVPAKAVKKPLPSPQPSSSAKKTSRKMGSSSR
jgi:hypothetical protein